MTDRISNIPSEPIPSKDEMTLLNTERFGLVFISVVCVGVLVFDAFPYWISYLPSYVLTPILFAFAVTILGTVIVSILIEGVRLQRRNQFAFKKVITGVRIGSVVVILATCTAVYFSVPKKTVFHFERASLEELEDIENPTVEQKSLALRSVNRILSKNGGNRYFEVGTQSLSGSSYDAFGYVRETTEDYAPYHYSLVRLTSLGNGWYWFEARGNIWREQDDELGKDR